MSNPNQHGQPSASTGRDATQKTASSAAARKSERFDAFLSHNSQDKQDVEKIREKLETSGITIWIDRNELSGGDSLPTTLKRALQNSAACIVFIGAHGVGPWQEKEITAADRLKWPKRRMIPVFMPGSNRELPASLKEKELLWIEFHDFDDQLALDKLIKDIRTKIKDQSRWDRIRRTLNTVGVIIPLLAIGWAIKEFCTFQAELSPLINNQRQEIVITRRFDPRPPARQFRQGTWIFADELDTAKTDSITNHLELNGWWSPDWSPLVNQLLDSRLGLAELEWQDGPISKPMAFVAYYEPTLWGRAEPARVVKALVTPLTDQGIEVRRKVVESLEQLDQLGKSDATVSNALYALLSDPDKVVSVNAASSLVQLGKGDTNLIKKLFESFTDNENYVSSRAAETLVQLGKKDVNVIKALVPLLNDPNDNAKVIKALVAIVKDPDPIVRSGTAESLVRQGQRDAIVIEALVALLNNPNSDFNFRAAESLVQLGQIDAKVIEVLVAALTDRHSLINKDRAAESLVQLGQKDGKVIERIVELLKDPDDTVRAYIASSAAQLKQVNARVIDALVALLGNRDEIFICPRAAEALGRLGQKDSKVINALVALVKSNHETTLCIAATSLGQLGMNDTTVIEALVPLLKHRTTIVRSCAAVSLFKLGLRDANVIEGLVEALLYVEIGGVSGINSSAAQSLVHQGTSDSHVIERLVPLLKNPIRYFGDSAAVVLVPLGKRNEKVIEALVPLLKEPDSFVRSRTAAVLVQIGKCDADVIEALVALLKDKDSAIRFNAVESLGQLVTSDASFFDELVEIFKDPNVGIRNSAAKAIGMLAQRHSLEKPWRDDDLIADLADNDSSVRERAGIVLAYRRQKVDLELTPEEVRYLQGIRDRVEKLRKDTRPWVKQASLHALYHIEKRKAELEDEARKKAEQKTVPTE